MSGGGPGIGIGPAPDGMSCDTLSFETFLASPVPDVVRSLRREERLRIAHEGDDAPVLALTADGNVAGAIVGALLGFLIGCISEEFEYYAEVREINGGSCKVIIKPE